MTRIVLTGAAGFLGRAVIRALVRRNRIAGPHGEGPITSLVLVDRVPLTPPDAPFAVETVTSSMAAAELGALVGGADAIFHLAAALTIAAERDVAAGWAANIQLPIDLLEAASAAGRRPRLVYASSIAVFGGERRDRVVESSPQEPATAYGTAKSVVELLLADYSRRGAVDARALRLPIVLTRPGTPSPVISDIVAEVVRGPLVGRTVVSPLDPDAPFAVVTVDRAAESLVDLHDRPRTAIGGGRAVHQPGLTVTPREMVDSLERVAGEAVARRVSFAPQDSVTRVVAGWPSVFASETEPPLAAEADVDAVVRAAMNTLS